MERLPLRLCPVAGESLVGFLLRLAGHNSLTDVKWLVGMAEIPASDPKVLSRGRGLGKLSRITGIAETTLVDLAYWPLPRSQTWFFGHHLDRDLLTANHRRMCPLCMKEAAFHRAIWDLSIVTVCPVHGIRLIDRCPTCGRMLSWTSAPLSYCPCGADLTSTPNTSVLGDQLAGISEVYRVTGFLPGKPTIEAFPVDYQSSGGLLKMMVSLGWLVHGGEFTPNLIGLSHHPDVHLWLNTGFVICRDWPQSFYTVLLSVKERKETSYAFLARLLEDRLPSALGGIIQTALGEFVIAERSALASNNHPSGDNFGHGNHPVVRDADTASLAFDRRRKLPRLPRSPRPTEQDQCSSHCG